VTFAFPFLTDPLLDHFLLHVVKFFPTLQAAIIDHDLYNEFSGGLTPNLFFFVGGRVFLVLRRQRRRGPVSVGARPVLGPSI
jgi:hypothetical protein